MRRATIVVMAAAVLVAACSNDAEQAEVLGVALERTAAPAPAEAPLEPDAEADGTAARFPEPATTLYPSVEDQVAEAPDADPPRPVATSEPAQEPKPVSDEPGVVVWAVPDGHVGESGTIWTVVEETTDDGTVRRWVETSSTDIEKRDDAPDRNPLRVSLRSDGTAADAPEREAVCVGGLHADDEVAVEAHGTITVTLLVDGEAVTSTSTRVDVIIAPSSGVAAAESTAPVTVALSDTSEVVCSVTFDAD